MAKDPCPQGYRMNKNGRCVPKRSGELGLATSMFGAIGSFIGMQRQKKKEEEMRRQMRKEGIEPGEPIKSEIKKEKNGGTVFSRKSRKTNYNGKKKSKSKK